MWFKAVDICPFVFDSFIDQFKNREISYKVVSKNAFMLKYCLEKYKTQEMRNKVVDALGA